MGAGGWSPTYEYRYDKAGNRTKVVTNGVETASRSYNAANRVSGWTYDAAGNLTHDGVRAYTYDSFNRLTEVTAPGEARAYSYNGDGTLVKQVANGVTMRFTQDLAAPLSQVLQTTQGTATTAYLYGLDRLAAASASGRTWQLGDALGSVRYTLSDTRVPATAGQYDAWGSVTSGTTDPFGFTGELHDAGVGLVHLRAR